MNYDEAFTPPTTLGDPYEDGSRITTCRLCGAAVFMDEQEINAPRLHWYKHAVDYLIAVDAEAAGRVKDVESAAAILAEHGWDGYAQA